MIRQYEPKIDYQDIKKEISEYLDEGVGFLTEYKKTDEFENKLQEFTGIKHCIVVNNGTISLSLALLAVGVKPGDDVIVPALSMIATANAVNLIGANPVFIDIDPKTGTLDIDKAEQYCKTYKINAIIYVSLNGWYDNRINVLRKYAPIIEDNAQSFGSKFVDYYHGEHICKYVGDGPNIGSFSFSMPKIITTGQGGCITTNDDGMAKRVRKLKDFGRSSGGTDIHDSFGINSKFTEMQAITGLSQMKDIKRRVSIKQATYNKYKSELNKYMHEVNTDVVCPWFIDIYVDKRDDLQKYLKDRDIQTRCIYPPIPSQVMYSTENDISNAIEYASKGLWLPSSMNLTSEKIEYICETIKEFL